jgi:hypothetical protein
MGPSNIRLSCLIGFCLNKGHGSAVLHSMQGSQRVCENLKGNRKPVGFAKAYLSG